MPLSVQLGLGVKYLILALGLEFMFGLFLRLGLGLLFKPAQEVESERHLMTFNPFTPISATYRFYSVLCQTILLINGEPLRGERVNVFIPSHK